MSNTLLRDQSLMPDQNLTSSNGRFRWTYQGDGNMVIYDLSYTPPRAVWDSGTAGRTAGHASIQGDGNLVVYDSFDQAVWASGTTGHNVLSAVIHDDGRLVLYEVTPYYYIENGIATAVSVPANNTTNSANINSVAETLGEAIGTIEAILDLI